MADLVPLFPLGTVLIPGMPLSLHIFEQRYRLLVRQLLEAEEPRSFGVVAIRAGSEVGDEQPATYAVGCMAVVRHVEAYADGRFDLVAVGGRRFRLHDVDTELPYLRGLVELLEEHPGLDAALRAAAAREAFGGYWSALRRARPDDELADPELPGDPLPLSYLVAAAVHVDTADKQALLEAQSAADRLRLGRGLLRRETALIESYLADPPDELTVGPFSLN